ncbi:MAG: TrbC/VirB2 family protein [Longimicrobiales bacterium]
MNTAVVRRGLLSLALLYAIAVGYASPAWAAGAGGTAMPWNAPLETLLNNLSGPTAQTLGMLMFVVGALAWGFSRNEEHIRRFGGAVFGAAIAIGVVNLFNALGFQGATF